MAVLCHTFAIIWRYNNYVKKAEDKDVKMLKSLCEAMGNRILDFCAASGRLTLLLLATLRHLKDANAKEVVRQMALLGADSLPIVMMTILCTGMVFSVQTAKEFVRLGASSSVGGIVAIAMARELVPVLTGVVIELAEQIIEACAVGGGHGFHSLGQMRQSLFVALLTYEHICLSQFCHFAQTRRQRVAHGFGKSIFGIVKPSHPRIAACQPKACLSRHFGFGGIEARDVRKGGGGFEELARLELRPPHHQPRMFEERIELFALQISLFLGREGLAGGLRGAFLNGMNLNGFLRFRNRGFKIRFSQAARCLIAHTEYGQRLREIVLVALLLRLDALFVSLLPAHILLF